MKLNKKTTKALNKLAFTVKQNSPTIRDSIAKDRIENNPPTRNEI